MRIEDAARDVQMRDGVAVVEHRVVPPAPDAPRATEAPTQEASTASHSALRRIGCSVKVRQLAEEVEAVVDLLARELLQALGAEALARQTSP